MSENFGALQRSSPGLAIIAEAARDIYRGRCHDGLVSG